MTYRSGWIINNTALKRYLSVGHDRFDFDSPPPSPTALSTTEVTDDAQTARRTYIQARRKLDTDHMFAMFITTATFSGLRAGSPIDVRTRLVIPQSCKHTNVIHPVLGKCAYRHIIVPTGTRSEDRRDNGPDSEDEARLDIFIDAANDLIINDGKERAQAKLCRGDFEFHIAPADYIEPTEFTVQEVLEMFEFPSLAALYGTYVPDLLAASMECITDEGRQVLLRRYPEE